MDERVGHRAGLGDSQDAAARKPRVDVANVGRAVRREVHEAHAVGAQEGDPVTDREVSDLALHPGRRRAALDHAAAGDDHRGHAGGGGIGHDRGRTERVHRDQDDVGDLGQVGDRRIAGLVVELVVARVDEVAARRTVENPEVVPDDPSDPTTGRGAHDRDRARGEEGPEVDRRRRHLRAVDRGDRRGGADRGPGQRAGPGDPLDHPTTRPTPRFSSARATIIRWISDVPSQIRSTRSSRR